MSSGILRVRRDAVVNGAGRPVVLKGAGLGGWMKYMFHYIPAFSVLTGNAAWRTSLPAFQATNRNIEQRC